MVGINYPEIAGNIVVHSRRHSSNVAVIFDISWRQGFQISTFGNTGMATAAVWIAFKWVGLFIAVTICRISSRYQKIGINIIRIML